MRGGMRWQVKHRKLVTLGHFSSSTSVCFKLPVLRGECLHCIKKMFRCDNLGASTHCRMYFRNVFQIDIDLLLHLLNVVNWFEEELLVLLWINLDILLDRAFLLGLVATPTSGYLGNASSRSVSYTSLYHTPCCNIQPSVSYTLLYHTPSCIIHPSVSYTHLNGKAACLG